MKSILRNLLIAGTPLAMATSQAAPVVQPPPTLQRGKLLQQTNPGGDVRLTPNATKSTQKPGTPPPARTAGNPRQQTTEVSSFIDGSMVYGSDATTANSLRSFSNGLLKTSEGNLLPLDSTGFFLAGDVRANENLELTSVQTLFMREHNLIAAALATTNPQWTDEQIYQRARRLVAAEIQAITYREFLPALLGPNALRPYQGYNPNVNAGIATEFSTAGFRIGHTLINDDVEFLDNDGGEFIEGLELADAFFNPQPIQEVGPDPVLKYLATDNAQEVDPQIVDGLRNLLFGAPGAGGLDLASLNIQRGRDHGLADYNSVRRAYGLPSVVSFAQITSNPVVQAQLQSLYKTVYDLDLWVAGLSEDHLPGSSVGPTFTRIIAQQFERTRDGDRNWYEAVFRGPQLDALRRTRLSDVIRRNTTITKLQDNVFFFDAETTLASLVEKTGNLPRELIAPVPGLVLPVVSFDGSGNNPLHFAWGSVGEDLLRFSPAAYADGLSSPSGTNRPNPRLISNTVAVHTTELSNDRKMSSYVYGWGQFIDHDLGLTLTGDESLPIAVPTGDPSFDPAATGTKTLSFHRSAYNTATGIGVTSLAGNPPRRGR